MSCCAAGSELLAIGTQAQNQANEVRLASRAIGDGIHETHLSVPGIHCGGCIQKIEKALGELPGVERTRVNLSTKRVTVDWRANNEPPPLIETLGALGYESHLHDTTADLKNRALGELVRALAVAGFAASNIMLLSVSIWSGADPDTRDAFHLLSALIALPAVAYSGRIFFRSAWSALRHGHTNMDVPISIGVLLAVGMSLYETFERAPHAYFDASVSLLFFLLIGRTLDHLMQDRAREAIKGLARLAARGAMVIEPSGARTYLPVDDIRPGMTILLAAGERVPVDLRVTRGWSEIDCSLVSGESLPRPAAEGSVLQAGTLNLAAPLTTVALAAVTDSFLAEMIRMMEAAEHGRSVYRRIADRAARLYAPMVHLTALLTFAAWMIATGDAHRALTIAIAVLIITCPCALGLAVPMVQVVAARLLFEKGIMVKDGAALERLAEIDTVVFDKTGTLSLGEPRLVGSRSIEPDKLVLAAAIAAHSRHPYSRALIAAGGGLPSRPIELSDVTEHPGSGLEAHADGQVYRLGRPQWAMADGTGALPAPQTGRVVLAKNGQLEAAFDFDDRLRPGVHDAVKDLLGGGIAAEILSGDQEDPVRQLAVTLGVPHVGRMSPGGKVSHVASLAASGRKVLMVGDGLNDAPALAAAYASMAPASAADVSRNAADLVFLRESLVAVPQAMAIARRAGRLARQNLWLAVGYNTIAVPIAILGLATPLVAAVAMSASSVLVVANALRLRGPRRSTQNPDTAGAGALVQQLS
jgi:Cu2+-exporting ATPase